MKKAPVVAAARPRNRATSDGTDFDTGQLLSALMGALTGFGIEQYIRKSREVGFQHHLVKPIDLNKLDSVIQEGAASLLGV